MLSQLLIETCPAIVTAAPLSCNAGNGLLHIDPKNNSCASAARAIKNLASGVVGNEVGDIDCVDERYFQVRDSTRCPETADAINTVLQFHANQRGDLPLDYEECNDPTTQTTTATTTVATNAEETQCAFASWQSKMLMVKCNDYNTRWINRLLQICGVAGGGKLTCLGGKLTSATPELCGSHVEMLNQIVRDVSYNANPLHAPFRCAAGGKKVAHTTQDTDACSVDVRLLGKAGHLLLTDQYDGCSHNTQTSTETTTATSTVESTATTTAASTKTTTATHPQLQPAADATANPRHRYVPLFPNPIVTASMNRSTSLPAARYFAEHAHLARRLPPRPSATASQIQPFARLSFPVRAGQSQATPT